MLHTTWDTAEIGRMGEEAAVAHLRRQGLRIVARNWREGHYELDIVAERWGVLHFVEVKTRRAEGLTTPEAAITEQKSRSLHRAATAFLAYRRNLYAGYELQFDVVSVHHDGGRVTAVEWVENAIEPHW